MKKVLITLLSATLLTVGGVPAVGEQRAGVGLAGGSHTGRLPVPEGRLYLSTCEQAQDQEEPYCIATDQGLLGTGAVRRTRKVPWEIFTLRPEGSRHRITENDMFESNEIVSSPDGSRFAVAVNPRHWEECRVYVVRVRTGAMTAASPDIGASCPRPTDWSSDGKWILMSLYMHDGPVDLYRVRPDGSGFQNLTRYPDEGWNAYQARWVDNNRSIVFRGDGFNRSGIFAMPARGGTQRSLLTFPWGRRDRKDVRHSSVSPNRKRVAFVVSDVRKETHRPDEVFVMDVDGGNQRRVTFNSKDETALSWAPDSRRLAIVVGNAYKRDPSAAIKIVDVGNRRSSVIKGPTRGAIYRLGPPVWSPSARYVAFTVEKGNRSAVFIGSTTRSNIRQATPFDEITRLIDWHR